MPSMRVIWPWEECGDAEKETRDIVTDSPTKYLLVIAIYHGTKSPHSFALVHYATENVQTPLRNWRPTIRSQCWSPEAGSRPAITGKWNIHSWKPPPDETMLWNRPNVL